MDILQKLEQVAWRAVSSLREPDSKSGCWPSFLNFLSGKPTYPEINLKVASSTKLPISHLKRHSHFIIFV